MMHSNKNVTQSKTCLLVCGWNSCFLSFLFFVKMQNPASTSTYYKRREDIKRSLDATKEKDNEALELELHSDFPPPVEYALSLGL